MNTPEKRASVQAKKPYQSPVIRYYGAIRSITQAVGNMGANADGGTGSMQKTA